MTLLLDPTKVEADQEYLLMAVAERDKSDDPKAVHVRQSGVGAVIVGKNGVISKSANVLPPSLKQRHDADGLPVTESERYHLIEHAERAAIFKSLLSGQSLAGATLYCTRFPCSDCARAMVWAGISRVVLASGYAGEEKWLESQRVAMRLMRRAGVIVKINKRGCD